MVGGAAVTEEFHPGFRNSVAAYTVGLLNPKVIQDLALHDHGLRIVERRVQNFLPDLDGRYLLAGEGRNDAGNRQVQQQGCRALRGVQPRNRRRSPTCCAALVLAPPPNVVEGFSLASITEMLRAAGVDEPAAPACAWRRCARFVDLFTKSAGDYLDNWFEGALIKALFGFDAVVGNYASPYTPGTAYVMLHHAFGEVNGKRRTWGHAHRRHGSDQRSPWRRPRARHGVEIETGAPVREIIIERERAAGVMLEDGRAIRARAVVAGINPKLLYTRMIPRGRLAAGFPQRMRRWRCGSGTFRDQCRAVGAAPLHRAAGSRRSSHRRHHPGAEPRLHGPRLPGCAHVRMEPAADHRNGDPLDAR